MEVVSAMVIGRHSDDMICLPRYCSVSGVPLPLLLAQDRVAAIVEETRTAGDLVVELANGPAPTMRHPPRLPSLPTPSI